MKTLILWVIAALALILQWWPREANPAGQNRLSHAERVETKKTDATESWILSELTELLRGGEAEKSDSGEVR